MSSAPTHTHNTTRHLVTRTHAPTHVQPPLFSFFFEFVLSRLFTSCNANHYQQCVQLSNALHVVVSLPKNTSFSQGMVTNQSPFPAGQKNPNVDLLSISVWWQWGKSQRSKLRLTHLVEQRDRRLQDLLPLAELRLVELPLQLQDLRPLPGRLRQRAAGEKPRWVSVTAASHRMRGTSREGRRFIIRQV